MDEKTISSLESRLTLYSVLFWIIILYGSVSILLSAFVIFSGYEVTYLNFVLLIMSLVTVSMSIIALHALHKRSKFVPFTVITALIISLPTTVFVFPILLVLIAALVYGVYLFVFNRDMKELLSGHVAAQIPKLSSSERFVSTLSIYYLLLGIGASIMAPLAFFASGIGNPTGIEAVLVRITLLGLFVGAIVFFATLRALRARKPSAPYLVYVSCLLTLAIVVIVFYGNGPSSLLFLLSLFGPPLLITAYGSFIFLFNKDVKALFAKPAVPVAVKSPEVKS